MKILRIAQSEVDNLDEQDRFEAERNQKENEMGQRGPVYTAEVLNKISKIFPDRVNSYYVADGCVGWYRIDGIIYEVTVSPAAYGQHFDILKDTMNPPAPEPSQEPLPL